MAIFSVQLQCANLCWGVCNGMLAQNILLREARGGIPRHFTLISIIQGMALGALLNSIAPVSAGIIFINFALPLSLPLVVKGVSYAAKKFQLLSKDVNLNKSLSRFYEVVIIISSFASLAFLTMKAQHDEFYFMALTCVFISPLYYRTMKARIKDAEERNAWAARNKT